MDKISLNIPDDYTGQSIELVHRSGTALPLKESHRTKILGTIKAPADFYIMKTTNGLDVDLSRLTAYVNYDDRFISIVSDEHIEEQGYTIKGELKTHTDLNKFRINDSHTWTLKALAQFLKMNRSYFNDPDENMMLVANLQSFKAKVVQELENSNDLKGNKKYLFEQKLRHDIPLEFTLNIPIFKGGDNFKFKVDVLTDITEGSVSFWMESVELRELEQIYSKKIIDKELDRLKGLTIIHQ